MLVSNATLIQIAASGGIDTYDAPATIIPKWTGEAEAYLDTSTARVNNPGGQENVRNWKVYLQRGMPAIQINIGDVLIVTQAQADLSFESYTLPVLSLDDRSQLGMPADVQTVLMLVEPTAPEPITPTG